MAKTAENTFIDILAAIIVFLIPVLLVVLAIVFYGILIGIPIYVLWNLLIPSIVGWKSVTFMQACGIGLLCSFLFNRSK